MSQTSQQSSQVPLCVDLDGTLLRTDVLWESMMKLIRRNPLHLFLVPLWLLRGRAHLKRQIASRVGVDAATLPYNRDFLDFLRGERRRGRTLVLVTAADRALAQSVAKHTGLFHEVLASDGETNLRGHTKASALAKRFGKSGFDYAGNSTTDLPVWKESRRAIVVNASESLARRAGEVTKVEHVFDVQPGIRWKTLARALRPHQWVKNLIILVPLLTSHRLTDLELVRRSLLAFVSFSLCASAVYVVNDLLDLEADRRHARNRGRPFASGEVPIPVGMAMVPLCLTACVLAAWGLSWQFDAVLGVYFVITTSYSLRLKQTALADVFCLAGLYTIRLVAGQAATGIENSFWLLVFSMFIFLSLALVKRFTELDRLRQENRPQAHGRNYRADDLALVSTLGLATGCTAVLVMALYVHSEQVAILYRHPTRLLLVCPLQLYWISRTWLMAHRGKMHDDPIVFALTDKVSYLIGALTLAVLWSATGR
jgi:4-hydroxybenzoate polyprenyltransferase/phosphoserine phosphatase